ncbi:MAG: T9SS type A sorting domain-containing protein [Bacteroidota bacterium]|nr:T9SS type A sorting domain-containing protein [Bacteroidota bacterium]
MKNTVSLILLLIFIGHFELKATHLMGGDITYQSISPGVYKITFKFYRDCRGIPLNSPSITMFCETNPGSSSALNYARTSIKDITPVCSGDTNNLCNQTNTFNSGNGFEEHVFEATVDFNSGVFKQMKDAGCCKFKIQMSQCCRNGILTTISPGNFYVDAMMDICNIEKSNIKVNSSPLFMNLPVLKACCNKPLKYNYGAVEIQDGDSLSFELSTPLNGNNSNENYTGNFNSQIPMTPFCPPNPGVVNCRALPNAKPPRGFYFDKTIGDIVFTPTKCDEVGIIALQVNEWRINPEWITDKKKIKWLLIGYIKREMQVIIFNCDTVSNPPIIDNTTNFFDVCEGDSINFDIKVQDQDTSDTIEMDVFHNIPNTTYQIIENSSSDKIIRVTTKTVIGDGQLAPYSFVVNAQDNSCPYVLKTSQGFSVIIRTKPMVDRKYTEQDSQVVFEVLRNKAATYSWTIKNENDSIIKQSAHKLDSFSTEKDKTYFIKLDYQDDINCENSFFDTISTKPNLNNAIQNYHKTNVIVYPNPSGGVIKIEGINQFTKLSVFDIFGKELMINDQLLNKSISMIQLQLPKGIYLLKIEDKEIFITKKVTIY